MQLNVFIKTIGCQMNFFDSERLLDLLSFTFKVSKVADERCAHLLILNTCSIREKSYFKVFSLLGEWKLLKEKNNHIIIVVLGCIVKHLGFVFFKYLPFVDIILGSQAYTKLPDLINSFLDTHRVQFFVEDNVNEKFSFFYIKKELRRTTTFVTIMEGCSKFCSYCVVPYTRGVEISRSFDDIIVEIIMLGFLGIVEVVLLGQNVNDYKGEMYNSFFCDFSFLLQKICRIKQIQRIKFLTSHPINFTESLIHLFKIEQKISSSLHLPLQSGSDNILKKMKRIYTVKKYFSIVKNLKNIRSNLCFTTDLIIGFPGEQHFDFLCTLQVILNVCFDYSYFFLYSKRAFTEALTFFDPTSILVKKKRLMLIQKYCQSNIIKINKFFLYSIQRIIVLGVFCKSSLCFGYSDNNRLILFYSFYKSFNISTFVFVESFRNGVFFGKLIT